jgi:hypothetical protein
MQPAIARVVAGTVALAAVSVPLSANGQQGHARPSAGQASRTAPTSERAAKPILVLSMNGKRTKSGSGVRGLHNDGRASVQVSVIGRDGGRARLVRGRYTRHALRLPALSHRRAPQKAEIRVSQAGRGNPLSPGLRSFQFGAEFALDRVSVGGTRDNGDNLIQRGNYRSPAQYKIQVEAGGATCRVKGSTGAVQATVSGLTRERWYRVRCQRVGDSVVVRVWVLKKRAPRLVGTAGETGAIGSVRFPRTRALSVGGRLDNKNRIPAGHTDQFNGVIDQAFFDLG